MKFALHMKRMAKAAVVPILGTALAAAVASGCVESVSASQTHTTRQTATKISQAEADAGPAGAVTSLKRVAPHKVTLANGDTVTSVYPDGTVLPKAELSGKTDLTCHGHMASTRIVTWSNELDWIAVLTSVHLNRMNAGLATTYWYCPNGPYTAIIKMLKELSCITPINDLSLLYGGAGSNPYYYDSAPGGVVVNPGEADIPVDLLYQECALQKIDPAINRWILMSDQPAWQNVIHVKVIGYFDQHFRMKAGDDYVRIINPANNFIRYPLHAIPAGA